VNLTRLRFHRIAVLTLGLCAAGTLRAPARAVAAEEPPLQSMVPELADHPYRLEPGVRPYEHRLAVSPAFGFLGSERLFAMRIEYSPTNWLSYEGSIAHNPGRSVHAVLHTFTANLRHPLTGRLQPFVSGGYGMIVVFPGLASNADPVTKNALTVGGGMELFIRNDLALRADLKHATVFGRQGNHDGIVAYNYLQETIGLSFCRTIQP
jgi:hypothetical protein